MKETSGITMVALASNTIRVIVFAALAIAFDKWWIVLLSIFFLDNLKNKDSKQDKKEGE